MIRKCFEVLDGSGKVELVARFESFEAGADAGDEGVIETVGAAAGATVESLFAIAEVATGLAGAVVFMGAAAELTGRFFSLAFTLGLTIIDGAAGEIFE